MHFTINYLQIFSAARHRISIKRATMNDSKTVIERLREVIALECKVDALNDNGVAVGKALAQEMAEARSLIPTAILGHHDRMRARGKRSVAPVRNGVCGACHLRLPISHAISMNPTHDLEVCDNCGVFLYVEATPAVTVNPLAPASRRTATTKRTKKSAAMAS